MRSLLIVPNHSMLLTADGGARLEAAEADLLRALRAKFDAAGVAAFAAYGGDSSLAGLVTSSEATFHPLNRLAHASRLRKLINYAAAATTLPLVMRRYQLLYIFCPGYCGWLAAVWARVLGIRYGLYVRGTWLDRRSATNLWWRCVFEGASFMVATGEAFRRRLARYCEHVVNEVPLTALRPGAVEPSGPPGRSSARLLYAGRLQQAKGMLDVVRALAILRKQGVQVELTLAGGGVEHEVGALTRLCEDLGVRAAVTLCGHLAPEALAETYRSCAMFVFPSYYAEGFPRVLYEAMMFSLPIVTCKMPGTEGFLVEEVNCLLCPPSDPMRLAATVRRLLDDPALGQRLARRARRDVEQLYESFTDASHAEQVLRFASLP